MLGKSFKQSRLISVCLLVVSSLYFLLIANAYGRKPEDCTALNLREIAAAISSKKMTSVACVKAYLQRINHFSKIGDRAGLNAFISLNPKVMALARVEFEGRKLEGIPTTTLLLSSSCGTKADGSRRSNADN